MSSDLYHEAAQSGEQVLGQQEHAEDDHRGPGAAPHDARDRRAAVQPLVMTVTFISQEGDECYVHHFPGRARWEAGVGAGRDPGPGAGLSEGDALACDMGDDFQAAA